MTVLCSPSPSTSGTLFWASNDARCYGSHAEIRMPAIWIQCPNVCELLDWLWSSDFQTLVRSLYYLSPIRLAVCHMPRRRRKWWRHFVIQSLFVLSLTVTAANDGRVPSSPSEWSVISEHIAFTHLDFYGRWNVFSSNNRCLDPSDLPPVTHSLTWWSKGNVLWCIYLFTKPYLVQHMFSKLGPWLSRWVRCWE